MTVPEGDEMSDLEQLDEYIDKYIEQSDPSSPWHIPSWVHDLAVAAQAHRDLLANGERLKWCETHGAPVTHDDQGPNPDCVRYEWDPTFRYIPDDEWEPCRIVSRLLVVPPKEEE